jgi:hypothetical protein
MDALDLRRNGFDGLEIEAVITTAAKRLAAQLEQNAVVLRRSISYVSSP